MVGAEIFCINNNMLLCIVDYHRNFPVMKKTDGLSVDDIIKAAKILFKEFKLPKKIVSDASMNFLSDQFKEFCRWLNIDQAITSPYNDQSNGLVKACIMFVKCAIKML